MDGVSAPPRKTKVRAQGRGKVFERPRADTIVARAGKKSKRSKKASLGREALRGVQERTVPKSSTHANRKQTTSRTSAGVRGIENASGRRLRRGESSLASKRTNRLIEPGALSVDLRVLAGFTLILAATTVYALWPTLVWAEMAWRLEPDYSHGYLILPLACILLWLRKDSFPGLKEHCESAGLTLIALSIFMRIAGRLLYMDFLDGYSLVPLIAGIVWYLCGFPALRWSAPAIAFLVLLIPLPYRFETGLSWELQGVATALSTCFLRVLGLPAISEGHTIWIGETQLMVAEACSGMRIFVGMIALAAFWAATVNRSWIDRLVVLGAAIPLALLVNALRITATGVLYDWFPSGESRKIIHDWSGYLMIPLAAALLWATKAYWEKLYRPVQIETAAASLRRTQDTQAKTT